MAGETVLIIEDDATLRRGLKDNFEARGYRVHTAHDGRVGLDTALSCEADLIILDIMLPKLNGFEICRAIREHELDVPIIMLTAKGQEEDIIRGLNLGADDYCTKPFSIRELLARVQAFLRRRRSDIRESYRFGDCVLDFAAHKLFRAGVEVALSPKEFRLLEFFVQRAGRALTRDEIMSRVWGSSVVVTSRSVDRCITTLRGKIEPDPRHPCFIQTIRDIGYRFEVPESETSGGDADDDEEGTGSDHTERFVNLGRGARLGRYEIRSLLGRGGMAEVYRARDSRLGRDVAVKVLSQKLARDRDVQLRFGREARAVAALSHPNIVGIHDVSQEGDVHFAVMELLDGEPLRDRLDQRAMEWGEAVEIALSVAEALAAAHGAGVTHRDIKPGNIFLTRAGGVKLLDFGLARLQRPDALPASDDAATMTVNTVIGTVMGTADYMSPEQVRGQETDARGDMFSLGAVLYEMVSGRRPFSRRTPADTMAAILMEDAADLGSDCPTDLRQVVERCLNKDPNDRYQSASDLAASLRSLLGR